MSHSAQLFLKALLLTRTRRRVNGRGHVAKSSPLSRVTTGPATVAVAVAVVVGLYQVLVGVSLLLEGAVSTTATPSPVDAQEVEPYE